MVIVHSKFDKNISLTNTPGPWIILRRAGCKYAVVKKIFELDRCVSGV